MDYNPVAENECNAYKFIPSKVQKTQIGLVRANNPKSFQYFTFDILPVAFPTMSDGRITLQY